MSNEIERFKYKKDIIKCVEESWTYYGKEDEQRKVLKELRNVYKIASSAKNAPKSEYEAKAKAFDEIESIHLNMFGDTVREITMEEAENFGMSVMRVLKIGEDK